MSKFTCKKHMGDDRYSWAVFKDGKFVTGGMAQHQARWYRDQMIAAEKKNREDAARRMVLELGPVVYIGSNK